MRGPTTAFAMSPIVVAEGSRSCIAAGASRVVAAKAMVASGLEATRWDDDLALGFASSPKEGQALRLDLATLVTKAATTQDSRNDIRRLVPIASRADEAASVADTDCPSHLVWQARTVEAPEPFVVGTCMQGIAWAPSATDAPVPLWSMPDPARVEGLRGIPLGEGRGYAVAMRYEDAIVLGSLDEAKQPRGNLVWLPTRGTRPGTPSLAASEGRVLVAWDDRDGMKSVLWQPGAAPQAVRSFGDVASSERDCAVACEEQAMAPSLSALADGRFLVVYSHGTVRSHGLRAQTLESNGAPLAAPVAISEPAANVVGRARALVLEDGRGAVVYFASTGTGFQAVATPIMCGP